jgi:hypothetical protein
MRILRPTRSGGLVSLTPLEAFWDAFWRGVGALIRMVFLLVWRVVVFAARAPISELSAWQATQ